MTHEIPNIKEVNDMGTYKIQIKSNDAGGGSELIIQTDKAQWVLDPTDGIAMNVAPGMNPFEVKISRLEMHGTRLYIERNVGDGTHWILTCAIEAPGTEVRIQSTRQAGGDITVQSPADFFTHGPQASPLVASLRLA